MIMLASVCAFLPACGSAFQITGNSLRLPPSMRNPSHASSIGMELNEGQEGKTDEDAGDVTSVADDKKPWSGSSMPTDFLGIFDTTTSFGALGASLVVAAAFGFLVETIKFIDPNTSSPSIFGSLLN